MLEKVLPDDLDSVAINGVETAAADASVALWRNVRRVCAGAGFMNAREVLLGQSGLVDLFYWRMKPPISTSAMRQYFVAPSRFLGKRRFSAVVEFHVFKMARTVPPRGKRTQRFLKCPTHSSRKRACC